MRRGEARARLCARAATIKWQPGSGSSENAGAVGRTRAVENVWIPAFAVAGGRYRSSELETIREPHAPPSHQALRRLRLGQGPRGLDQAAPEAEEAARREAGTHPHHAHDAEAR